MRIIQHSSSLQTNNYIALDQVDDHQVSVQITDHTDHYRTKPYKNHQLTLIGLQGSVLIQKL